MGRHGLALKLVAGISFAPSRSTLVRFMNRCCNPSFFIRISRSSRERRPTYAANQAMGHICIPKKLGVLSGPITRGAAGTENPLDSNFSLPCRKRGIVFLSC
ncbi:hypothetical protein F5Y17DRAFT_10736 [Xylariaceae sp. FL0594]|nr:hypothetical protein F5Y17DRAFT_10736 [Xylariaceae sp. FL0594]